MFTGIVESTGLLTDTAPSAAGRRLRVEIGPVSKECKPGDSISVSGVCLTVAAITGSSVEFDVIGETLARTTLGTWKAGDRVNIERSLRVGDRFDGHFVQGHVDGTATVESLADAAGEFLIWLRPQDVIRPYIIPKGSVAIDGVSMTIAAMRGPLFSIALIPTTLQRTTLGELRAGDVVNIETDVVVRTIVHRMTCLSDQGPAPAELQGVGAE